MFCICVCERACACVCGQCLEWKLFFFLSERSLVFTSQWFVQGGSEVPFGGLVTVMRQSLLIVLFHMHDNYL